MLGLARVASLHFVARIASFLLCEGYSSVSDVDALLADWPEPFRDPVERAARLAMGQVVPAAGLLRLPGQPRPD